MSSRTIKRAREFAHADRYKREHPSADRHYCPACPESFKTDAEYREHWKIVHIERAINIHREIVGKPPFTFPRRGGQW